MRTSSGYVGVWLAIVGLVGAQGLAPNATQAQQQAVSGAPLTAPLPREDPRAQLDPSVAQLPPVPIPIAGPATRRISKSAASREISYDTTTGIVRVRSSRGSTESARRRATRFVPGRPGINHNSDPEEQYQSESVIGPDGRVRVGSTTTYPWRAQCKLLITAANGVRFIGSGTLIAAKYVLTAGHCVYMHDNGGWARSIEVIPGLNGTYKPYGSSWATRLRTYSGWTASRSPDHDFALVTLNQTIGNTTGWLGYGYWPTIINVTGNISGYPGDRDGGIYQYYHYGPIIRATSYRVFYQTDTAGGQSGSGVYRILNTSRYVFAVHAYGASGSPPANSGTRIDSTKFSSIQSWIASGT